MTYILLTNALHIITQYASIIYSITETPSYINIYLEIIYMSYQYIMCKYIYMQEPNHKADYNHLIYFHPIPECTSTL